MCHPAMKSFCRLLFDMPRSVGRSGIRSQTIRLLGDFRFHLAIAQEGPWILHIVSELIVFPTHELDGFEIM